MATDHDEDQDNLKGLRAAARAGEQALAENAELKKQLLFAKAGIDTDSKIGSMLYRTWEGDDLTALKVEAQELGLLGEKPAAGEAAPTPAQQDQGQQQFRDAMAGGRPAGQLPEQEQIDPVGVALQGFHEDIKRGGTREAAQLAAIDKVLVQAVNGNRNAIFDPTQWNDQARQDSALLNTPGR